MRKRLFSLFTSLIMVISLVGVLPTITVSAETSGDYEYEIESDYYSGGKTVKITGYLGSDISIKIPSKINGYSVTRIGDSAFKRKKIVAIDIPEGVTTIDRYAFRDSDLTAINIPKSAVDIDVTAFEGTPWFYSLIDDTSKKNQFIIVNENLLFAYNCSGDITIPKGIKVLPSSLFEMDGADNGITSVTVPEGVIEIQWGAFQNYSSWFPSKLEKVKLPNSLKTIGGCAFSGCSKLKEINIPDNLEIIDYNAFAGCTELENIKLPNGVKEIGSESFYNCQKLKSVSIPKSVETIEFSAFENCSSLIDVKFDNESKCSIGRHAFFNCYNLKNVMIPMNATGWHGYYDYSGEEFGYYYNENYNITKVPDFKITCYIDTYGERYAKENGFDYQALSWGEYTTKQDNTIDLHIYHSKDSTISLPSSINGKKVTSLCMNNIVSSFDFYCPNMTKIIIPSTVLKIGACFQNCKNLNNVTIPNSVTSITSSAFGNCPRLKSITIPSSVTSIGEKAFGYCYGENFKDVKIPNFKIKCYKNTAGEKYAKDNGFAYELLDKPVHVHNYTSKITKQPTCTATGIKTFSCSCGDKYTQTIAKTAHKYTTTVVKPTYAAQGYTLHKCSVCGTSYKDNYKAKLTLGNITKVNFTSSSNAVKMSWNKVSGATGYRVYQYNTSTKKWKAVANIKNTNYTFKNLKSGTTYKFTVRAYKNQGGKTYLSPKYTTFTSSTNPATVNFKLTAGSKKATVKWSKVTGATGYKVYYKTSKNGSWKLLKTANNKTTSYNKTGLTKGKTYYFTVKAYRMVGGKTYNGSYNTKSVKVK